MMIRCGLPANSFARDLRERPALRRHQDDATVRPLQLFHCFKIGPGFISIPGPPPYGLVVNHAMLVVGESRKLCTRI